MKLKRVNPELIKVPEVRVTARMDEEKAEQFKASVAAAGIDEPIKVFEVDGELILSDGLHRLLEAIHNKMPLVDVYVRPGTMEDVLCNNLMSGHLRGTHPVSEMVRSIEVLWKEYNLDSEKIAAKTGMTRDYVEKLQLISELTPMGRAALDEGRIKYLGHALALIKIKDPVIQETVLGQLFMYNWSVRELEQHVANVLAIPPREPTAPGTEPPPPPEIKCHFCRQITEIANIANPNVCTECAGILLMSIAAARAEISKEQSPRTE